MEFLADTNSTNRTLQSVRCTWKPIILLIGHFEGPTEAQLSSW